MSLQFHLRRIRSPFFQSQGLSLLPQWRWRNTHYGGFQRKQTHRQKGSHNMASITILKLWPHISCSGNKSSITSHWKSVNSSNCFTITCGLWWTLKLWSGFHFLATQASKQASLRLVVWGHRLSFWFEPNLSFTGGLGNMGVTACLRTNYRQEGGDTFRTAIERSLL